MDKTSGKKKIIAAIFVTILTIICFVWSVKMPYKYGSDEEMKMDICKYIYEKGQIPNGGDEAVRDECWGISYAFTPILDYMMSAMFMKAISVINSSDQALLVAARLPSVLSYMGLLIMTILISKKIFKSNKTRCLFVILISCLPELIFLGSYINNDCFALFCISFIIYSWLCGIESKWGIKSCLMLGISMGICALSYYNSYGYILTSAIIFIMSFYKNQKNKFLKKEFFQKGLIIFFITFAISGWWFIRNAYLYNGDFLGLKTTDEYGEKYGVGKYKPSQRITPSKQGQNLMQMLIWDQWLWQTIRSSIAVFGNMTVMYPVGYYISYLILYIIAIVAAIIKHMRNKRIINKGKIENNENKDIKLVEQMFIINIIIPLALSMYYSYFSDFQAQGRYIMPALIPFMYFVAKGWEFILNKAVKKSLLRDIVIYILMMSIGVVGIATVGIKIIEM